MKYIVYWIWLKMVAVPCPFQEINQKLYGPRFYCRTNHQDVIGDTCIKIFNARIDAIKYYDSLKTKPLQVGNTGVYGPVSFVQIDSFKIKN
jgi:hypothetical protein